MSKLNPARARTYRKTPVLTERLLWNFCGIESLAGSSFGGRFRSVPMWRISSAFERRLIVEADGPQHDPERDAVRDEWLKSQGFRVLRFANAEVQNNAYAVLDLILEVLG